MTPILTGDGSVWYLQLTEGEYDRTVTLRNLHIDLDAEGNVIGIEGVTPIRLNPKTEWLAEGLGSEIRLVTPIQPEDD